MATWTVSAVDETCGHCGAVMPPDQPIALVTAVQLMRCADCARRMGLAVDEADVDAARHRREVERLAGAARPVSSGRPVVRHDPRRRGVKAAAELRDLFDPKIAAANDRA